ncbi:Peroxisomal biogenesis factor 19 [Cytospora mali]|uniref:Peroxisomal biogenesis factor 19 n=1 Tax=Cytospora mali TaxID=578113 RepID=A0A194V3T4_CYTMA|nr:Peroxisomal biogenesis factor 19 [Valsa mali var. pyri (nom. inval.)]
MASKSEESDAAKADPKTQNTQLEDMTDVPDPDEDDLDDLDGMPSTLAQVPDGRTDAEEEPPLDDDFAKQLQEGMAELMGEIDSSPEMQAQFESIFKELGAAAAATGEAPPSTSAAPAAEAPRDAKASSSTGADASFQETIRRTMERMQASGEQATAAAQSEGSDDFMAELLKQMQAGGMEGGLEGSEEEFSKMLMGMMEQLTNKDILYEPMKELNDKFPDWMAKNKDKISEEDRKRYELQEVFAREIVAKFEESTYADSNAADREYIVDRMQKMQAAGSPPPDLVGDMPSAQEAMGAPDAESCNPQ